MDESFTAADELLERELTERGPRMLHQEAIEGRSPDPEFVNSLRRRLAGESRPVPIRRLWWHTWSGWSLGAGAATVAAVVVLALLLMRPHGTETIRTEAFVPPTPTRNDISRGYPPLVGQGGGVDVSPCTSGEDQVGPVIYPRPIRLTAHSFSASPQRLSAYRLANPSFDASRIQSIAHSMGIRGPVQRVHLHGELALCVAQRIGGPTPGSHSVIISTRTGEMIVREIGPTTPSRAPVNSPSDVTAVQRWLRRLGWPSLPEHHPSSPDEREMTGFVLLDWNSAGPANVLAGTLLLDAHGQVLYAHLWPPVVARTSIPVRSYRAAFNDVMRGKIPLGVEPPPRQIVPGSGHVTSMGHTSVLTLTGTGAYLTPAYRFSGPVQLGSSSYRWSALAPAG